MADAPVDAGVIRQAGRLAGLVALITGAGRGIGRAVALRFAAEGATVILVGRTQGALEEVDDAIRAAGHAASLVPGDLADEGLPDRIAAAIFARCGRLDILVGNAAEVGQLGPLGHIPVDVWQRVIEVNLNANWRLLRACDPLLRLSQAGRAIFVTAGPDHTHPYFGAYAVSKAGLEAMVQMYAREVGRITPVRANLIDPGARRTRLRARVFPGERPENVPPPDDPGLLDAFLALAEPACERNGEIIRLGQPSGGGT
jgi:NAD(P)-dependent dehydrogenase (short-subunit alcohol dehydrogenase family)